jgi:hypothetical protein
MDVTMDVKTTNTGKQELVYSNNSSDTLKRYIIICLIMHSSPEEMDARLHSIKDPDGRMVNKVKVDGKEVKVSRIEGLKPDEIGYLKISNFKQTCCCRSKNSRDHT